MSEPAGEQVPKADPAATCAAYLVLAVIAGAIVCGLLFLAYVAWGPSPLEGMD